jgi:hypothetical protein
MKTKKINWLPIAFKFLAALLITFVNFGAIAQTSGSASGSAIGEKTIAGTADLVEGDVRVFDSQKKPRTIHVGDKIYEGDSVATGTNGELHLTMEDNGFIAVRPNTKMRITKYRAQGDERDTGIISLLVGSLRSVTGWIGKHQPRSYAIRTPTATIGIRGTDHEPMVVPEGSAEGEPGTYDKVNIGGSFIKTSQGQIDVPAQRAAFAPHTGNRSMLRPRLLESVPRFYRHSRNERFIVKKHEFIQRTLNERREERRRHIKERLNLRGAERVRHHGNAQTHGARREDLKNRRMQMREERLQEKRERHGPRHNKEKHKHGEEK